MWFRAFAVWLLLAVVAVAAGMVREALLTQRLGEAGSHLVGTAAVVVAFWMVILWTLPWILDGLQEGPLVLLGVFWAVLTVLFEFGFGHFVVGHPWSRLFRDYNFLAGRVWILVILTLLLAPTMLGRMRS